MKITSAEFIGGFKGSNQVLEGEIPQVAVIGRSNVGKSSLINSVTGSNNLARTSNTPGRTQEINVFLINKKFYLVDLPGYGYAKTNLKNREKLQKLILWYLFGSDYNPSVFLIIDANVGPTKNDLEIFNLFQGHDSKLTIIANKIDKIKSSEYSKKMKVIEDYFRGYKIIPYSSHAKKGVNELRVEMFQL